MSEANCRGCGMKVIWVKVTLANGNLGNIPLDPSAPVYEIDPVNPSKGERTKTAMVSHFKTCSKANEFSGSKRT